MPFAGGRWRVSIGVYELESVPCGASFRWLHLLSRRVSEREAEYWECVGEDGERVAGVVQTRVAFLASLPIL